MERVASLEAENAALREEIARLKGLKGRLEDEAVGHGIAEHRRPQASDAARATGWFVEDQPAGFCGEREQKLEERGTARLAVQRV
ncbi:MAG: hypothetical protein R3C70_02490 [Geminicoccaceae bacterium]